MARDVEAVWLWRARRSSTLTERSSSRPADVCPRRHAASSPGAMGSGGTAKQKKKHYSRTAGGKVGDEDVEQILYGDDHLEME